MTRLRAAVAVVVTVFLVFIASTAASAGWTAGPHDLTAAPAAATATATLTGTAALSGTTTPTYQFVVRASSPLIVKPLTATNTGTAPLTYTLSASATGTLPAASVALTTSVAGSQGQSITGILTLTGRVGTQWTAPAPGAAFTQSVFRTGDPTGLTCTPKTRLLLGLLQSYVTLSWIAPVSTGTGLSYQVVRSPGGAVVKTSATTSVDIVWADLGVSPQALLVQAAETQYGTTSAGVPITLTGNAGLGPLLEHVNCPS